MKISRRILSKAALEAARGELEMETWDQVLNSNEVNLCYNKFLDVVVTSMSANTKKRMVTTGITNKKWLTDRIKIMSRIKLYEGAQHDRIDKNVYNE
ncbi:hypothetical protein QE152_g32385 [Popillia japonica]|uniref:Uncharacterized protein n=1 Tax=Popillia japonica TaxID=7064 RepID=A0AAW1IZ97_POPJA